MERLLTPDEVCELLGVSPSTLSVLRREHGLPAVHIGYRTWRYRESEVQTWLGERTANTER